MRRATGLAVWSFRTTARSCTSGWAPEQNVADDEAETNRADVLEFNPDGTGQRIYASGIRNASGITMHPKHGQLWAAVNERDALGDDLVPDYVTHVHGRRSLPTAGPGITRGQTRIRGSPASILIERKSQSFRMCCAVALSAPVPDFYDGKQFPADIAGNAFVTSHGSWNRAHRTGYKVVGSRLRTESTGEYEDFALVLSWMMRTCGAPPGRSYSGRGWLPGLHR